MKVFLPFNKTHNSYLYEIEQYFDGVFVYGQLKDYNTSFSIVSIHWPEALFGWREPTFEQLLEFENTLKQWKKKSKLIYTRHNEQPHYNDTENFKKLYDLIHENVDGIIHLGTYSLNQLENKYRSIQQVVINHPLYMSIKNSLSTKEARERLEINQKSNVILVFGKIRSKKEKRLIIRAFKKLNIKNKVLLVPSMPYFISSKIPKNIRFFLKGLINKYYKTHPNFYFENKFIDSSIIQDYLSASDIIFIPRIRSLNSGNIFLGITFKKVVVGPNIGNMKEVLERASFPTFHPNEIETVKRALEKGIELSKTHFGDKNYYSFLNSNHSEVISKQYYDFFNSVLNG